MTFAAPVRSVLWSGAVALCVALLSPPASAEVRYAVLDLGALAGTVDQSAATGINAAGTVVGVSFDKLNRPRAFVFDRAHGMRNLGLLPGAKKDGFSAATHIDDEGGITGFGTGSHCQGQCAHGFYLPPGGSEMRDLGPNKHVNSNAAWSNRKGDVGGIADSQAVVWRRGDPSKVRVIEGLPGFNWHAVTAISNDGTIVGWSQHFETPPFDCAAWVVQDGIAKDLGNLGGICVTPYAVNRHGAIVGTSTIDTFSGQRRAFVWTQASGMIDLGLVSFATSTTALGINDKGEVVGSASDNISFRTAFLHIPGVGMLDLNQLIPADSGVSLADATGINNKGEISASGWTPDNSLHAFLLTPLP